MRWKEEKESMKNTFLMGLNREHKGENSKMEYSEIEKKKKRGVERVQDVKLYLLEHGITDSHDEISAECSLFSINPSCIPFLYSEICKKKVPIMMDHGRLVLIRPFEKKEKQLKDYLE